MSTDDDQTNWTHAFEVDQNRRCRNCGAHVTPQTARTMGDADDVMHHCFECIPGRDMHNGAASDPGYDPAVDRISATRNGLYAMDGGGGE